MLQQVSPVLGPQDGAVKSQRVSAVLLNQVHDVQVRGELLHRLLVDVVESLVPVQAPRRVPTSSVWLLSTRATAQLLEEGVECLHAQQLPQPDAALVPAREDQRIVLGLLHLVGLSPQSVFLAS